MISDIPATTHMSASQLVTPDVILTDDVMNGVKLPHPGWDNLTREELFAELTRLQADNARLAALLPARPPLQSESVQLVQHKPLPAVRNTGAPVLSTQQKIHLFRRLFHGRTHVSHPRCARYYSTTP